MQKAPKLIYLLRKSVQDETSIPVLKRNDLPLRFYFKGCEFTIAATKNGNIEINKTRLFQSSPEGAAAG